MRFDVVTLFPNVFEPYLSTSLLGKAIQTNVLEVALHDLRAHGLGKHRNVDDEPYGGGAGMVLRPEPIFDTVDPLLQIDTHIVTLTPRGRRFDQVVARELAEKPHVVLICGRFEGIDQRVALGLNADEISIGDFVLAGGELGALVIIETVARLLEGFLGNPSSLDSESHSSGWLEYPQYTRPEEFRGMKVPEVLLSGDHGAIERWRREQSEQATRLRRPDLI